MDTNGTHTGNRLLVFDQVSAACFLSSSLHHRSSQCLHTFKLQSASSIQSMLPLHKRLTSISSSQSHQLQPNPPHHHFRLHHSQSQRQSQAYGVKVEVHRQSSSRPLHRGPLSFLLQLLRSHQSLPNLLLQLLHRQSQSKVQRFFQRSLRHHLLQFLSSSLLLSLLKSLLLSSSLRIRQSKWTASSRPRNLSTQSASSFSLWHQKHPTQSARGLRHADRSRQLVLILQPLPLRQQLPAQHGGLSPRQVRPLRSLLKRAGDWGPQTQRPLQHHDSHGPSHEHQHQHHISHMPLLYSLDRSAFCQNRLTLRMENRSMRTPTSTTRKPLATPASSFKKQTPRVMSRTSR